MYVIYTVHVYIHVHNILHDIVYIILKYNYMHIYSMLAQEIYRRVERQPSYPDLTKSSRITKSFM